MNSRPGWACYLDLDGTLLGRGASLLHDGDGAVSLLGARALEALLRAGVEVVLMSGRRRAQVAEDARLFGQTSYIYEAGCVLVLDGEEQWLTAGLEPGERSVYEQIDDSGAPQLLLDSYPGRLEYHEPWAVGREISHLFRGLVDVTEVDALLARSGHETLRLVDNGVVRRRSDALSGLAQLRGYHLIPAGASKAAAVALHMRDPRPPSRGDFRDRRLARGSRCRRAGRHLLGRRQRARATIRPCATRSPRTPTFASPMRPTAPASMRP